ncbi:hypothetical protein PAP_04025 [Palaeococcus pacificus DY20341]|uniref:Uncharacterized protein n=1 Tax=Palaeococcus pacificus DY20341 TaxID=1343739 RepID=A0A075LTE3_9EURY|nr:hypothetical protein [Palaeococcus pacificus]AIF69222.1 hypothetical protein PAP_04025 [Palaeococcus pacificus DY20341]
MTQSPKLRALLKMIEDLGEDASWPLIVNRASDYGLKFIELKPLIKLAEKRGYIIEEGGFYRLNVKIKRKG